MCFKSFHHRSSTFDNTRKYDNSWQLGSNSAAGLSKVVVSCKVALVLFCFFSCFFLFSSKFEMFWDILGYFEIFWDFLRYFQILCDFLRFFLNVFSFFFIFFIFFIFFNFIHIFSYFWLKKTIANPDHCRSNPRFGVAEHYTTLHYTTLHYTTLPSATLHYITLHYTPLHYNYNYDHTTTLHYAPLC